MRFFFFFNLKLDRGSKYTFGGERNIIFEVFEFGIQRNEINSSENEFDFSLHELYTGN